MDLRVFDQGKLWEQLQRAGYSERGFRTVRRWIEQGVAPTPEAERVILEIIGVTHERAAPSMTRRLLTGVIALENKTGITKEDLASAGESAEKIEAAFELAALESDARLADEITESQRKSDEQAGDQGGGQSAGSQGSKRRKS